MDNQYYIRRKAGLLKDFDTEARIWESVVIRQQDIGTADGILREARKEFEALIPQIPYIGGYKNHLTRSLLESVRYLAFYKAMKKHGKTAEETGEILYKGVLTRVYRPLLVIPAEERLTIEQFIEQRRKRAESSQKWDYPEGYKFRFIVGDGRNFDYGYDYTACGALNFYHNQGADEFMPFYCYLDFPVCRVNGIGFTRTMTMSEGYKKCNHRIKRDGQTRLAWPPPFLRKTGRL